MIGQIGLSHYSFIFSKLDIYLIMLSQVMWCSYPTGEQLNAGETGIVRRINCRVFATNPPQKLWDDDKEENDEEGRDVEEKEPLEELEVWCHARAEVALDGL